MILHQEHNSKGLYNYNAFQYFNSRWAAHFHKNFELIYLQKGSLSLTVSGNYYTMTEGSYALILSNRVHAISPIGSASYWIAVFSEQFVPLFARTVENRQSTSPVFFCEEEVHRMIYANLILGESSHLMKKSCFYAVCDQYLQNGELIERQSDNDELICRILEYVAAHYRDSLTLAKVARVFGYEYHYLSRILNRGYGINFSRLVNEYRIDHALHLLEESDLPISQIASESGFQSIRSFNHVFLEATGHSPSAHHRVSPPRRDSLSLDLHCIPTEEKNQFQKPDIK